MALRVNAQAKEKDVSMVRVRDDSEDDGGIDHGHDLAKFVDAFMSRDESSLESARKSLAEAMGPEGVVEAAAVAGNFQRMVRIADCTGIPFDDSRLEMTADIREELGINAFRSAENTLNR